MRAPRLRDVAAWAAAVPLALAVLPAAARPAGAQVQFDSLDGTPLAAWVFQPAARPRGTVVALHGCGGLYSTKPGRATDLGARHQAMVEMLLAQGYAVVLPDSFTPRGATELCTQAAEGRTIRQKERRADALGALAWVARQPWADAGRIALLGWSHGGSAVLAATDAGRPEVARHAVVPAVAVAFYPGCSTAVRSGYKPSTRLVLMLGEKDDWTAPGPCVELGKQAGARVHVFEDSHHGFDAPGSQVRLRQDVPGGVHPGQGVHTGGNPVARERAYALVRQSLRDAFR